MRVNINRQWRLANRPKGMVQETDFAYHETAVPEPHDGQFLVRHLCPEGINIFFDNVGGAILDAALALIARKARVVLCGGISRYNAETAEDLPPEPKNYFNLVFQRARMEGFLTLDYAPRFAEAEHALQRWLTAGQLTYKEDIQAGFTNAPKTLLRPTAPFPVASNESRTALPRQLYPGQPCQLT